MNLVKFVSSVLLGLLFLVAGVNKIFNIQSTSKGLQSITNLNRIPLFFFKIVIIAVIIIEILAPIIITLYSGNMVSKTLTKGAVISLVVFTILASFLYHSPLEASERISFMKNMSIVGGLLAFYGLI